MSKELANVIAKRFLARRDVKAVQYSNGAYSPIREPWTRADLDAHLAGTKTFGHYLINQDDRCKLFCFDIDLEKDGVLPFDEECTTWYTLATQKDADGNEVPGTGLRAAWHDRTHPGRTWMKTQFMLMATILGQGIKDTLGIDAAVAYSGNKGVHVYGLMPTRLSAIDSNAARDGAMIVLDELNEFVPHKGNTVYKHKDVNYITGFPNLSIEIFPKQNTLDGKDLGNLVRLPLGRNQRCPNEPTFFMDMTRTAGDMRPLDPLVALAEGYDAWSGVNA